MAARQGLSQDVVNGVPPRRRRALHERASEAHFFYLERLNTVAPNVFDTIARPKELLDGHSPILDEIAGAHAVGRARQCHRRGGVVRSCVFQLPSPRVPSLGRFRRDLSFVCPPNDPGAEPRERSERRLQRRVLRRTTDATLRPPSRIGCL